MASPVATGTAPSLSGTKVRSREPSEHLLRVRTWLRRPRLDAAIARGLGRPGDARLALREAQLVEPRQRGRLARRLEEIVESPTRLAARGSRAPIDRRAVEIARPVIADLVLLLRSRQPVEARGVALAWSLLTDPLSPLYEPDERGSFGGRRLWRQSLEVLQALRPASAVQA